MTYELVEKVGKEFAEAEGEVYGYEARLDGVYIYNEGEYKGQGSIDVAPRDTDDYLEVTSGLSQDELDALVNKWSEKVNAIAKANGVHITMVDFTGDDAISYNIADGEGAYFDILKDGNY